MDFNELEKIIKYIKDNYCNEEDYISIVPQDYELIICINGDRVCYLDKDEICDFEDFMKELDHDTIENIKKVSKVSSGINRLKDLDEVGVLQIDFLQVLGTGSEYIQIDHDLRTLKNSLNNCIRRVNLLTNEIKEE